MFYILQCLKCLFFSFYNFAVQQVVEREFNRDTGFFFFSGSRCLEGFSYLPHSRQSFFSMKGFNAMVSVCLFLVSFSSRASQFGECMCLFLQQWLSSFSQCGVALASEVQGLRPRGRRGPHVHRPPGRRAPPGSAWTPSAVESATARQHPQSP